MLLLERSEVLNFGSQAQSALRQTRDVGSAFWTLLLTQTWLTVFTCVMTIVSIAFFSYGECRAAMCSCALVSAPSQARDSFDGFHSGPNDDQFPLDLSYIGFLIILPCLLCMYQVMRECYMEICIVASGRAINLSCTDALQISVSCRHSTGGRQRCTASHKVNGALMRHCGQCELQCS